MSTGKQRIKTGFVLGASVGSYVHGTGGRIQSTMRLKALFDAEGQEGLSEPEREELRVNLKHYRISYCQGTAISEKNAQILEVDDEEKYETLKAALE